MQFDLQVVVFANGAFVVTQLAEVDRFLKTLQVLVGEFECRFSKLHVHEQRGGIKRKTAFIVGHQGARLGGNVLGSLQPVLALLPAFDQIAETEIAFGRVVQILGVLTRTVERKVFPISKQRRVGAQVRSGLFGFALLNRGPRCQQVVVVLERHLNGLVERDTGRSSALGECRTSQRAG